MGDHDRSVDNGPTAGAVSTVTRMGMDLALRGGHRAGAGRGKSGVTDLLAIEAMRARVEGTGDVAGTLATGWDAFELLRAVAAGCADGAGGLFAAFTMASVSAAAGRDAVGVAPSLAPGRAAGIAPRDEFLGDAEDVADAIGVLAATLRTRLSFAAAAAADAGDRAACARAAGQ